MRCPALQKRGCGTEILAQALCIAGKLGFHRLPCVCDENILKNGGAPENTFYDPKEAVTQKDTGSASYRCILQGK